MSDAPTRSAAPDDAAAGPPAPADGARDLGAPSAGFSDGSNSSALPTAPPGNELPEEIGTGEMGVVYRSISTRTAAPRHSWRWTATQATRPAPALRTWTPPLKPARGESWGAMDGLPVARV